MATDRTNPQPSTPPAQAPTDVAQVPDQVPAVVPVEVEDKPIWLPPKRERFAQLVASGWSQAAAYRAAMGTDVLATTSHVEGCKWAADPSVRRRVDQLTEAAARASAAIFGESRAAVVRHNVALATADARRLFHEDGRAKLPHELDDEIAQAVESVEVEADGRIKYKLARRTSALDMVNRIAGLYEADNRQQAGSLADALRALAGGATPARIAPSGE